jgi:hypothetical protein
MKAMLTLFACAIALATAAPALAGNGQSVSESLGAMQVSSTNVSPALSVAAPVGASAPVCVAGNCSSSQSVGSGGLSAATVDGGTSHAAGQRASESAGSVQAGSTNVSPVVSAAAPVGVSAPMCAASRCSTNHSVGNAGSADATVAGGESHVAGQQVSRSLGSVQVGSTNVSPVVSAAAPIGVSAPVCAAGTCSSSQTVGGGGTRSGGGSVPPPPSAGSGGSAGGESSGGTTPGGSSSGATQSAGSGGAKAVGGAQRGVGSSAGKVPRSGVFTPTAVPHGGHEARASGRGRHAARNSGGCDFAGTSAKFRVKPTAAGFAPTGGFSWTLLLGILCGALGFSSLAQWVRTEMRGLKS